MGTTVVGVRFRRASKVYYFDPGEIGDLKPGDEVIVETSRGRELGRVIVGPQEVDEAEIVGELKPVERRAIAADRLDALRYQRREASALERCREMVAAHGLPMKVVSAEYSYDGSRLVFSFAADKRVDFRGLVRDLAKAFRARIELRQIGVRDEAKLMGGLGTCGRELCCRAWLAEFTPVSIKMAKHQGLPLSPAEISGQCGRLLCCLGFEDDCYVEATAGLPKVGQSVTTSDGPGRVVGVNALKQTVNVQLESKAVIEVAAEELGAPNLEWVGQKRSLQRRVHQGPVVAEAAAGDGNADEEDEDE
jgi:cell fate regulator YaaT (PSP1 superfamily)